MARRLVAAADAERERIEQDLHDGLQQHLTGLRIGLALAAERFHAQGDTEASAALAGFGDEVENRHGTDVIDLYQVQAPDPAVAIEETLEALEGLVRAGKVRALGTSNFPAWLLAWSVGVQDREGWTPFTSLEAQCSLVERSVELELLPFCRAAGLGVLAWGPLGAGFLSGRYRRGQAAPEGSRIAEAEAGYEEAYERRAVERNFRVLDAASAIAEAHRASVPQVPIAWLLDVDGVTAPILGARTPAQLDELLDAGELKLSAEERARLEAPAPPAPIYPQRMLREQVGIDAMPALRRP